MHEARWYLGIDGGQSSTTALIGDKEGRVVGVGHAGPCNHVSGSEARAKFHRVIGECLRQASSDIARSGSEELVFASACLGLSGGAEDKLASARELIRAERLKVTNDAEIALLGALAGQPGIIVIAGTGSIAFGKNRRSETARAGGWGYLFGDEGGGFYLAREALRAALRCEEGWGPPTILRQLLLQQTEAPSANDLLHRFYREGARHSIAPLAPLVSEAAEAGDSAALGILADAAEQLASYVEGVYRNLFSDSPEIPVAFIGGAFRSTLLRSEFTRRVQERLRCRVSPPKHSPAAGALLEALRMDGNTASLSAAPETKT